MHGSFTYKGWDLVGPIWSQSFGLNGTVHKYKSCKVPSLGALQTLEAANGGLGLGPQSQSQLCACLPGNPVLPDRQVGESTEIEPSSLPWVYVLCTGNNGFYSHCYSANTYIHLCCHICVMGHLILTILYFSAEELKC